jgi:hypothetical protein
MRDFVSHPKGKYTGWGGGFENRALKKIFGPKFQEVREGWGKLRNQEVPNSYSSKNAIWENKIGRVCSTHGLFNDALNSLEYGL